ncbi:MAG TPA: OsmC family protein [Planctomycetota bacterium]|nr:OsmC family protein [Planctomycetota bacterium]
MAVYRDGQGRDAMESRVVVRTAGEGFENEVEVRGHRLRADEPVESGGTDRGPSPSELLLAALGACTSITLRMYAKRKGWDLQSVEVVLGRRALGAGEGAETEITRTLRMAGALDATQRARLAEVAGKFPVHRALNGGVRVATKVE